MAQTSPGLWHMRSKVLSGFYQSEVIVAAGDRDDAIRIALQAYDHWLKTHIEEMGFHPLISDCYPDDEEYGLQSREKRQEFDRDLRDGFTRNPHCGLLLVAS